LIKALRTPGSVRRLDIRDNKIGGPGLDALITTMRANQRFLSIKMDGNALLKANQSTITRIPQIRQIVSDGAYLEFPFPTNDIEKALKHVPAPNQRNERCAVDGDRSNWAKETGSGSIHLDGADHKD
jgi:hypothetical protein